MCFKFQIRYLFEQNKPFSRKVNNEGRKNKFNHQIILLYFYVATLLNAQFPIAAKT